MYKRELEDMEILAASDLPFDQYRDKTFMITGATGLVGSLLAKNLLFFNRCHGLNLRVVAVVRNIEKAKTILQDFLQDEALSFVVCDLAKDEINYKGSLDYIIHAAAITQSKMMIENPVETIQLSVYGTDCLLRLAKEKSVKCFVYISSMEVYGNIAGNRKAGEKMLGYIDLESARSSYPEGKRMSELLCNSYSIEYGIPVIIARLAQTFGAGILRSENRVFAQFARSALRGENIVLHTQGKSEGNYVYTRDAIKAILLLLSLDERSGTFNISNESSHTTIAKLAEMVANEVAKEHIEVVYDIPEQANVYGYAPDTKLFLDSEKIRKLGWYPEVGLKESFERMIDDMMDMEKKGKED